MSSFAAEWLSLREPFDLRARNSQVRDAVVAKFTAQQALSIVDLACGTGSTLRAIANYLPGGQSWKLVDNDLGLLAHAAKRAPSGLAVTTLAIDLARDLEAALDGPADLVTTSALLDLVSERWLERLAVELAARKLPFYAALTLDRRIAIEPSDPLDNVVIAAAIVFQQRDLGFGPALGPDAGTKAIAELKRVGYALTHGSSDWLFGPQDRDIQTRTLESWAEAARQTGLVTSSDISNWLAGRREAIAAGRSSIRIGHVDLFADPIGLR